MYSIIYTSVYIVYIYAYICLYINEMNDSNNNRNMEEEAKIILLL